MANLPLRSLLSIFVARLNFQFKLGQNFLWATIKVTSDAAAGDLSLCASNFYSKTGF